MKKLEESDSVLMALLKLSMAILFFTIAIDLAVGFLTGFSGTLGPYPYTQGK